MNIYKLTFNNNQSYIGQTKHNIEHRFAQHLDALKGSRHKNKKMSEAYVECGTPEISLLEACVSDTMNEREIYWISFYDTYFNGLNQTRGGDNNSYHGEESHNAKYTDDDYAAIYSFLAHSNMTFQEIAKELDVSYAVVQSINYGKAHQYLEQLFPIEAKLIKAKHGFRNAKKAGTYPQIKSPDGIVYTVNNCTDFARIHGLDSPNLGSVLNGKRKSHLGWTLADPTLRTKLTKSEIAKVISPSGIIHSVYDSGAFAEEHDLNKTAFARLLSGNFNKHKGWTLHV